METSTPLYYQLVYTLTGLLPPPLDDTPEALQARNRTAIAKVAALLPVNANEIDLAAQCIAARAQAEEMLRLLRQHAADIGLVMRLNAQYGSMVRTSLSVHGRLMRVQALRQKRQAIGAAVNEDAWAQQIAEQSMLQVLDPGVGPLDVTSPNVALDVTSPEGSLDVTSPKGALNVTSHEGALDVASPAEAPVEVRAAYVDPSATESVSEDGTNSQHTAFETWLSEQPSLLGSTGSGEPDLRLLVREAMPNRRLGPESVVRLAA